MSIRARRTVRLPAPRAASRSFHPQDIAGLDGDFGGAGEGFLPAGADEQLTAGRTFAAAFLAEGFFLPVLGGEGNGEGFEKLIGTDDAVAAGEFARPAGMAANAEFNDAHGITALDDFGIGDGSVGHVRVDRAEAVVFRAGAGAAADGFVVAKGGAAEDDVVHGALAAGLEFQ